MSYGVYDIVGNNGSAPPGVTRTRCFKAFGVLLDAAKAGDLPLDRNAMVAVDEFALLGTRQGLELLRLQGRHGFQIVALGDPLQCAAIEAGNIVALARRALGSEQVPELLTTRRQQTGREREIVGLFREGRAKEALDLKRADGSAEMVPGGYREAIARVARLYAERLQATGEVPTVITPTNLDAGTFPTAEQRDCSLPLRHVAFTQSGWIAQPRSPLWS